MFTPTIIKVLKYLKDTGAKKTKEELATIIEEELEYVNKALERLVTINVVTQKEEGFLYHTTPYSDEFSARLLEVYETVSRKPAKELIMRGLICQIPSQYLLHIHTLLEILGQEGVDKQELEQFLEQEMANGYLRRIKVIYIGIEPSTIPICIPPYYYYHLRHLGIIDHEKYKSIKQEYQGYELHEEDYLIAQYPPEVANPAKEYIERERKEMRDSLRRKGWLSWGGELWRFK